MFICHIYNVDIYNELYILSAQGFVEFISKYQLMFSHTLNETDCANTILNTVDSADTNIILTGAIILKSYW